MFFSGSNPKSPAQIDSNVEMPKESNKNALRSTILLVSNHHKEHMTHNPTITKKQINENIVPHINNLTLILSNIFYFKF